MRLTLCAALVLRAAAGFAQSGQQVAAPVTVTGGSGIVTPGAAVQLSGTSVAMGGSSSVKLDVVKPDHTTVSLTAAVTPQGSYALSFTQTAAPGTYTITAHSPDGKSTATATFQVAGGGDIGQLAAALDKSATALAAESRTLTQSVTANVDSRGSFPDKQKVDDALAQIDQKLGEIPGRLDALNKALGQLADLTKKYPALAADPALIQVAKIAGESRDKADAMVAQAQQLTGYVPKASGICDTMDTAAEALNFTSLVFDFMGSWPMKIAQILTDKGLPEEMYNRAVPLEKRNAEGKTAFIEYSKGLTSGYVGGAEAFRDFMKGPFGLAADMAQYLLGLGFDKLCERYIGPIEGVFSVDATAAGKRSWGYTTYIKGRIFLRFEKKQNTGGVPVPLTGEFEGMATKFDAYEDLFAVNQLNKNSVLFRKLVTPVAAGDTINWLAQKAGRMATALAVPNYFLVPIKGVMQGDTLTIEVAPAAQMDFRKDLSGTAWYVSIPFGSMIPVVQKFDLPMQNAQFILSRALRNKATVTVSTEKKGTGFLLKSFNQTFTRQEVVSNGEVTVKWNLNVKACNPDCP